MKRNHIFLMIILIIVFLGIFLADLSAYYPADNNNVAVKWMESLGDKYVFLSEDYYVIMDKDDADKIPSVFACDVNFYEIFSCEVLESHSFGNIEYPRDVLYVKNVNYIREEAFYFDV